MPETSLTATLITNIAEGARCGEWPSRAAARLGVSTTQWRSWSELGDELNHAAAASEAPTDLTDHEELCLTLVRGCEQAEAECEGTWLRNLRTACATGRGNAWTAWMTLLERRFPARWAKRSPESAAPEAESMEQILERIRRETEID
jgi:hypothetical protein